MITMIEKDVDFKDSLAKICQLVNRKHQKTIENSDLNHTICLKVDICFEGTTLDMEPEMSKSQIRLFYKGMHMNLLHLVL